MLSFYQWASKDAERSRDSPRVTQFPGQDFAGAEGRRSLHWLSLFYRLVWRGYRRPLRPTDLWSLGRENTSEELVSQLEREWKRNLSAAQR